MTSCAGPGQIKLAKPGDRVGGQDRWMKPVCGPDTVQRERIGNQKVAKRTECLLFPVRPSQLQPESVSKT